MRAEQFYSRMVEGFIEQTKGNSVGLELTSIAVLLLINV